MKILRIPSIFVRICKCKINRPHDPVTVIHRHTHLLPQFKPAVRCFSHQFISFFIILIKSSVREVTRTRPSTVFSSSTKNPYSATPEITPAKVSPICFPYTALFQLNCLPLGLICTPFHLTGMLCNLRQYLRIVANALFAQTSPQTVLDNPVDLQIRIPADR